MGKKSRKKGAAAGSSDTKASRRERLQERREQQLEVLDRDDDESDDAPAPRKREYFVGDRVWFHDDDSWGDGRNPNTYRGIVKRVHADSLDILSLQSMMNGGGHSDDIDLINVPLGDDVYPDFCNLTLRFNVGDRVLCRTSHGWEPKTITYLWPIGSRQVFHKPEKPEDDVPRYKCEDVAASYDDDVCIMKHQSSFRFEVGDSVIFNPELAEASGKAATQLMHKSWLEGTVTSRDITCLEYYAVYKCSFDVAGKQYSCFVTKDDDEHIARKNADPRSRLFEAIEQDCNRCHLIHLATTFSIDVTTFRDLVTAKAFDSASYHALSWLQHECNIDVLCYKDERGNNFLHNIAYSSNAACFIKEAGRVSMLNEVPDWNLHITDFEAVDVKGKRSIVNLTSSLNNNGETWLQVLVRRGDSHALDAVLSPNDGLAWKFSHDYVLGDDELSSLAESVKGSKDVIMQCIVDSFIAFRSLSRQCHDISYHFRGSEDDLLQKKSMIVYQGESATIFAKLLSRFVVDWQEDSYSKFPLGFPFSNLISNGYCRLFSLLYDANDSLFLNETYKRWSNEDRNEYIQPELSTIKNGPNISYRRLEVDITMACIICDANGLTGEPSYEGRDYYFSCLRRHALFHDFDSCSWLSRLKKLSEEIDRSVTFYFREFCKSKIRFLEDDGNLQGRLQVLDFVLSRQPKIKLNVLEAIKHRQCGVLRFMVDRGLVQIESGASSNRFFTKNASKFHFLDNGRLSPSMSTKCFLCFAAVEYDDLQSLQWICESFGMPAESCDGWNLLHFSAFMGRMEIVAWLNTQPVWQSFIVQGCQRKPFQNAFAVHIAAMQGHIMLVELMLEMNVSPKDEKGKTPEFYAKKSHHRFAQEWGAEREKEQEKPRALEKHIKKLLELVKTPHTTSKSLENFIITSGCFDTEKWIDCDYCSSDEKGPMGYSFSEIINQCCSNFHDHSFVLWLCTRLYFLNHRPYSDFWGSAKATQEDFVRTLTRDDLVSFAAERGYSDLSNYLQKKWFSKISCVDPITKNCILKSALGGGDLLLETRATILRAAVLAKMAYILDDSFRKLIRDGGNPDEVDDVLRIGAVVKNCLVGEGYDQKGFREGDYFEDIVKPIDMSSWSGYYYPGEHTLFKQLAFIRRKDFSLVHVLATEGFSELFEYCLRNVQGWTSDMELDAVRLSAFYGHSSILDLLMKGEGQLSSASCRFQAALLGFGEACKSRDMIQLLESYDDAELFLVNGERSWCEDDGVYEDGEDRDGLSTCVKKSLICAVLNGYMNFLFDSDTDNQRDVKTLRVLIAKCNYTHKDVIHGARMLASFFCFTFDWMGHFIDLVQNAFEALNIQPILYHEEMQSLCKEIVKFFDRMQYLRLNENTYDRIAVETRALQWLGDIADQGIDIQNMAPKSCMSLTSESEFIPQLLELGKRQLHIWSQYDVIINCGSLKDFQAVLEEGGLSIHSRYRGGLMLTHLSSAYDRDDLLEWLVATKGMDVDSKDGEGRSVLEVAKAAHARSTIKWIVERQSGRTIATFVQRHHHRMLNIRRQQRLRRAATNIQRKYRGDAARKIYSGLLLQRLDASPRFQKMWGKVCSQQSFTQIAHNWSSIRERVSDIKNTEFMYDDGDCCDTDEQLSKALEGALQINDDDNSTSSINAGEMLPVDRSLDIIEGTMDDTSSWLTFQMTSHVVKFLKHGDPKYKAFFVRRMQQLADGERSRILQKRLKGSSQCIFETYLEQKSGFRILWTEEGDSIVVWFVAKHKEVSRLMRLIDDSKSRTARQRMSHELISDFRNENLVRQSTQKDGVLLDVFGNVPLKLYEATFHSINEITKDSWTPKLHLTEEERDIVETEGTVLVQGRSGTGKTVCLCNRIEFDRQKYGRDPTFSQLFVARSKRLCRYVSETAGTHERSSFLTFEEMIRDIDAAMPHLDGKVIHFLPSQRIDFQRFRREFHQNYGRTSKKEISALIVWTVIRTFIKGSIQSFETGGILPRESFTDVDILGKKRCRVPVQLRENVYDEFEKYEMFKKEKGLWDDCDRVCNLLLRFENSNRVDPAVLDRVRRSKIYVDEIQDYTQIECLVFFYLGGPESLFLAGDSAQSVVEGTEFRFEEIRRVGHFVAGAGSDRARRKLVPQKHKTVNINFRSHAGILNTAAAFLDVLFKYFPGSAEQLKKDRGLFQGSRPGFLHNVDTKQLALLLSDNLRGTVVLVHDESSQYWRRALGDYKLVYGIREAKGLEFKSVIILNFFLELPSFLHKPWRNLLLNREALDFEIKHPLVGAQLKLLYTGITRCIERLFFVETSASIAGDAVVRWLTTTSVRKDASAAGRYEGRLFEEALATRNNITNIESMSMTSDEFISEGLNNAEIAESAELELEQAHSAIDRSIWCFEQAGNHELAAKARVHRQAIDFRLDLVSPHQRWRLSDDVSDHSVIEMKGAQIIESLTSEGLLFEVLNIFYSISPFISHYVKEELERCFIFKIRSQLLFSESNCNSL